MNTTPVIFTIFTCSGAKYLSEDVFNTHYIIACTSAEAEEKFRRRILSDRNSNFNRFIGQERAFVQTDESIEFAIENGLEDSLIGKFFVTQEDLTMTQQQIDMWIRSMCQSKTQSPVYREILI